MDLNDIALFVQVVRAGSFAEAGRRLGMPPSTVSRRLQTLEQALGTRLMQRTTRRLVLTDAGRHFFSESADQIDALQRTASQVSSASGEVAGRVRIAVPADFFAWFPAQAVAGFLEAHPKVRLEFELNDARVDLLGECIDVALRAGNLAPGLHARRLGTSHETLVASPAYLADHGAPLQPHDLATHLCITTPSSGGLRTTWRLGDGQGNVAHVEVSGSFQANTASARLAGALAGMGIALLPTAFSAPHLATGQLQEVLPAYSCGELGMHLVYHSRRQLPLAVAAFIEFAAGTIKAQGLMRVDRPRGGAGKP